MDAKRFTGPQAGSQKYDLLTALSVAGLSGSAGFQTSMMRLIAAVTARYNWQRDELTVGQRDLARMWSVDERTVKREIKRLTTAQILLQLRPGVRGRVAAYRLNSAEVFRLSAPVWDRVGPDFAERMDSFAQRTAGPAPEGPKVVRLPVPAREASPSQSGPWGRVRARLAKTEPMLERDWYSKLQFEGMTDGILTLTAPSAFIARYVETHHRGPLWGAAEIEFGHLKRIFIST